MHKHKWKVLSVSQREITFRCNCGERVSRLTTANEKDLIKKYWNNSTKRSLELHKIAHEYSRKFEKYVGYELMKRVRSWAVKHPSVKLVVVDDSFFTSSLLVLIPHENEYDYMGTTVVFIPQNGVPVEFFLYERHLQNLQLALKAISKLHLKKRKKKEKDLIWSLPYEV